MSRIQQFREGFHFISKGFKFILANRSTWLLAALPMLINLIILIAMIALLINYYGDIYSFITSHLWEISFDPSGRWYLYPLAALLWIVRLILRIVIGLISLILILVVSYCMSFIIAAPFNDALSEKVERIATGKDPEKFTFAKFVRDLARTVKVELIKAAVLISIPIVLFVVSFIPIAGPALYMALTTIFGACDLGFSFAELPMGRRTAPFRERLSFARKNFWMLTGFGIPFAIPFFAIIFAPAMVAGGTLIYISLTSPPLDS
ncbi:MAG TPA: EI24 domain-containing protein [bacterium]|nr:hypothetical protein [Myxococcales bacterium]HPW46161.1 EI24 domain-containing protein [bacterium]HQC50723.1 EI24 domain-containing protein [bacterium]